MKLDISKLLSARSDRVKSLDFHPTEPLLIIALYNGQVVIYNTTTYAIVNSIEVSDLPSRCVKFIPSKQWFIVGSDDLHLRVYNYNTLERIASFEAHSDYIRSIAVHPTRPLVLSSADDMLIKCWDYSDANKWKSTMTYEGHTHYVMSVCINPKDTNQFMSCSLDKTIKMWSLNSSTPNYSIDAHTKGINHASFHHDKPYIITAADDKQVRVYDYQSRTLVHTLKDHTQNVCFALFHPTLPLIVTGGEDSTLRLYHSTTYRLENTLSYGMERAWCLGLRGREMAVGYDEGLVVVQLGRDTPLVSMDQSGKVLVVRGNLISAGHIQHEAVGGGGIIDVSLKELSTLEIYPHSLCHSPNGRFAAVCGDGEYLVYTSLSWRNKAYGSGNELVFSSVGDLYAVRNGNRVEVYKQFKLSQSTTISDDTINSIHGGSEVLSVVTSTQVIFFSFDESLVELSRIDFNNCEKVVWNGTSQLVVLISKSEYYLLEYINNEFKVKNHSTLSLLSAYFIGDCLLYTTSNRLEYLIGGGGGGGATTGDEKSTLLEHLTENRYLIGYRDGCVYSSDTKGSVYAHLIPLRVLEIKTRIKRAAGGAVDFNINKDELVREERSEIGRYLYELGYFQDALGVLNDDDGGGDDDIKYEIYLKMGRLKDAYSLGIRLEELKEKAIEEYDFELYCRIVDDLGDQSGILIKEYILGEFSSDGFVQDIYRKDRNSIMKRLNWSYQSIFARMYDRDQIDASLERWKEELGDDRSGVKIRGWIGGSEMLENDVVEEGGEVDEQVLVAESKASVPKEPILGQQAPLKPEVVPIQQSPVVIQQQQFSPVEQSPVKSAQQSPVQQQIPPIQQSPVKPVQQQPQQFSPVQQLSPVQSSPVRQSAAPPKATSPQPESPIIPVQPTAPVSIVKPSTPQAQSPQPMLGTSLSPVNVSPVQQTGQVREKVSLTGDDELDDILNSI